MKGGASRRCDAIVLSATDNVATALRALRAGEVARVDTPSARLEITVVEAIPRCHKFAISTIDAGQHVHKYGEVIGVASQTAGPGAHIHVHNIKSLRAT